jgi:hypothetical protein
MALPLVGLGKKLRKVGLDVRAVDGWQGRGRPYTFDPEGTAFHHTASSKTSGNAPSLGIVVNGRADIPGPLCNLLIGRNGTVFLIAAGYANHAGYGGPLRGIPKDSGNKFLIGVEVENNGIGENWSRELIRACDLTFAVCLEFVHRRPGRHMGHKEWAPDRKIDPAGVDMRKDRDRVRAILHMTRQERQEFVA